MKRQLIAASLILASMPVVHADMPLSYDANKYRSPNKYLEPKSDHHFEVASPKGEETYWCEPDDKIVTVTMLNGTKQKWVLADNKLIRLEIDKSNGEMAYEILRGFGPPTIAFFGGIGLVSLINHVRTQHPHK